MSRGAADLLQRSGYFSSVIHCSYYSCVQLMKHIIVNELGVSESKIDLERRKLDQGIHEYLINYLSTFLKNNKDEWKPFHTNINQLKKLRGIADYQETLIDSTMGNNSLTLSDLVNKQLAKTFNV
jgi:hypothetical protein